MSNFFHEYPYTNFHELNLDWILEQINTFSNTLDTYAETMAELTEAIADIDEMQEDIADLQKATADLSTIRTNIATLQSNITSLASQDALLQEQIDDINTNWDSIATQFENVYSYIDSKYALSIANINSKLVTVYEDLGVIQADLQNQITTLSDYIDYLVENLASTVYNPVWGVDMSLKENNARIYSDLNYGSLTVAEYQELNLTVSDYLAYGLTAVKYYLYGRFDLAKAHWTVGPISGVRKRISNALIEIVNFFAGTLTSTEYDALALTSDDYDDLALTVKEYYFYNTDGAITVSDYANINVLNNGILRTEV